MQLYCYKTRNVNIIWEKMKDRTVVMSGKTFFLKTETSPVELCINKLSQQ